MAITILCQCGKKLKAPDRLAGKTVRCPACGKPVTVPEPEPTPAEEELVVDTAAQDDDDEANTENTTPAPRPSERQTSSGLGGTLAALGEQLSPYAYWLFLLTFLPLAISICFPTPDDVMERMDQTLRQAPKDVQHRADSAESLDDLFALLPEGKLVGAHLPRNTWMHWLYRLLAALGFFAAIIVLFPVGKSNLLHLPLLALFTGTVGIALLLGFQFLADATQGVMIISRNPIIMLLFWGAWLIGFSYRAALDPQSVFVMSLLGFTFGVGLCEEVCKALPLIVHYRRWATLDWRGAFIWGLASGVGFGVAEGIMYSSDFYNGIFGGMTYVVRFVSCVALHAIWTASTGLFIYRHQTLLQGDFRWLEYVPRVFLLVLIPMILHGLYDTFLKKEYDVLALVVALISFGWLAYQIEAARRSEAEEAMKHFLKNYQRAQVVRGLEAPARG